MPQLINHPLLCPFLMHLRGFVLHCDAEMLRSNGSLLNALGWRLLTLGLSGFA
jgi:hypothetical protein